MAGRVGILRCRYQVRGRVVVPAAVGRLERMARERLRDELGSALDRLDVDGAVYVVRRVHARSTIDLARTDGALTLRWSNDLAGSVATAITTHSGDSADVVRFDDQAQYVAAFVTDLLAGTAWQRWYFGAFAGHRFGSVADAIEAVLREHRSDLPAILAELARRGVLEALLAAVDGTALGLRDPTMPTVPELEAEGWRPLLRAAHELVSALELWAGAIPDPEEVLRRWVGEGPRQPDWRDAAALTDAVVAVVRWLAATRMARHPAPADRARLAGVRAGLDWLDLPRLTSALTQPWPSSDRPGLPVRGPGATPRQRAALQALERAIRAHRPELDTSAPTSTANAVRLLAALARTDPEWAGDPLVPVLVEWVLTAWATVRTGEHPSRVAPANRAAEPEPALSARRGSTGRASARRSADVAVAEAAVAAAAGLGGPAADVLAALREATDGSEDSFDSPVAGVLLLQRVLLDVQLRGLAAQLPYPPAGPAHLVSAVGLWWAGDAGAMDGVLDPAVRLLAGPNSPRTVVELARGWQAVGSPQRDAWRLVVDDLVLRHRMEPSAAATDPVAHTARSLLRIWARWLRGFEESSPRYLLDQFVRRPGTVVMAPDVVTVQLSRRPLDTVLEVSGYLRPIEVVPGLASCRVEFRVGEIG